ncbi:MAG: hypothetical protein NT062_26835 [Proteobacteria bacterium]|nr:hypothetical protein [Pseudomonadota bacterium]
MTVVTRMIVLEGVAFTRPVDIAVAIRLVVECCKELDRSAHRGAPFRFTLSRWGSLMISEVVVADGSSLGYLSPELASGLEADARSHVFILGILLWELVVGRPLFAGATDYQTIEMVRAAAIPSARECPRGDDQVGQILNRALARDPGDRYPSIGELRRALDAYLQTHDVGTTMVDVIERLWPASQGPT